MTVSAEHDFASIGQLAAHLQKPVRRIEQAAAELGVAPDLRLNHVPYYNAQSIERITSHLNKEQK